MLIHDLDTPAVVCDLNKLERNLAETAASCRSAGIPLRSHTKSHKIPEIAHMQVKSGAIGICCQKVGEAEVMVAAGVTDILIPFNIVGAAKVDRLLRLSRRATITVALDSLATAQGIADVASKTGGSVGVVIELDTGSKRCGVQSPAAAVELGKAIVDLPGIALKGVMTYPSRPEITRRLWRRQLPVFARPACRSISSAVAAPGPRRRAKRLASPNIAPGLMCGKG